MTRLRTALCSLLALLVAGGCASSPTPPTRSAGAPRPLVAAPARPVLPGALPANAFAPTAVKAAEPPASPEHPGVVVKALPAPDPGARRLAEAIVARVVGVAPIAVEVGPLRNYSRASMDEFDALHERVAALLGRAGGPLGLTFDATAAAPYRLEGSAYLLPRFGTDTWEVYVRLMAADGATIWEPTGPVYLLRQARPNGLQIAFSAEALAATAEQP